MKRAFWVAGAPASLEPARPGGRGGCAAMAAIALVLAVAAPVRAEWGDPDTVSFRLEVGASTDLTNEQFYEDAFLDSISLGRRLVSSPESRVAGVLATSLEGTRGLGAASYRIRNELSLGDKLQRESLWIHWRNHLSLDWRLDATPRIEYRHDRSFDRDLREWRGSLDGRLRRAFRYGSAFAQLRGRAEFLRTSGQGALYLLDRNAGSVSASFESLPLFGPEWRLGYGLTGRVFPDSSERDHLEHAWDGQWRRTLERGGHVAVEVEGARRVTLEPASTSRDRFWRGSGSLEAEVPVAASVGLRARIGAEAMSYQREDSTLFFDYRIYRARLAPSLRWGAWSASLGARGEALMSPAEPSEEYREIAGALEVEALGRGSWWSVTPVAGWRDYGEAPASDTLGVGGLHSSYAFGEVTLLADQSLFASVKLHLLASARHEWHIDAVQNARSLYFSLDLRRAF